MQPRGMRFSDKTLFFLGCLFISATVKLYFSAKENSETMGQRGGITGISLVILSRDYNQSARVWLIWNAMNLVSLERPP